MTSYNIYWQKLLSKAKAYAYKALDALKIPGSAKLKRSPVKCELTHVEKEEHLFLGLDQGNQLVTHQVKHSTQLDG